MTEFPAATHEGSIHTCFNLCTQCTKECIRECMHRRLHCVHARHGSHAIPLQIKKHGSPVEESVIRLRNCESSVRSLSMTQRRCTGLPDILPILKRQSGRHVRIFKRVKGSCRLHTPQAQGSSIIPILMTRKPRPMGMTGLNSRFF